MNDLKIVLNFMLDYGGDGSLPNMDEGESGDLAYEASLRLAKLKPFDIKDSRVSMIECAGGEYEDFYPNDQITPEETWGNEDKLVISTYDLNHYSILIQDAYERGVIDGMKGSEEITDAKV